MLNVEHNYVFMYVYRKLLQVFQKYLLFFQNSMHIIFMVCKNCIHEWQWSVQVSRFEVSFVTRRKSCVSQRKRWGGDLIQQSIVLSLLYRENYFFNNLLKYLLRILRIFINKIFVRFQSALLRIISLSQYSEFVFHAAG